MDHKNLKQTSKTNGPNRIYLLNTGVTVQMVKTIILKDQILKLEIKWRSLFIPCELFI